MQIDIQSRGFSMTDEILRYAEMRLLYAMSFCQDHINRVKIRLSDINGPRGGTDKRCHLQVVIPGMPDIVVKDTEVDLYDAIDRAMDRARRTALRKIKRLRSMRKQSQSLLLEEEQQASL